MFSAEINKFIFPNKLNRQQSQRLSTSDKVTILVDSKIPITYLDENASDAVFVSGVKCKQGVLQASDVLNLGPLVVNFSVKWSWTMKAFANTRLGMAMSIHHHGLSQGLLLYGGTPLRATDSGRFMCSSELS